MTTNTAPDAAAADGTRSAGRTRGTSVVLRDLSRSFGATKALDGLSIEMAPGELVALLGPSGCGKTTALRIVGFGLRMRKKGPAERRKRAGELLDLVGLAPQAKQFPHQLSGGQQQR